MSPAAEVGWQPNATALALHLSGQIKLADSVLNSADAELSRMSERQAALPEIRLSPVDQPFLEQPTVLLVPAAIWHAARSSLGVGSEDASEQRSATWHEALPTIDGDFVLIPNGTRGERSYFFYIVRRLEDEAFALQPGSRPTESGDPEIARRQRDGCLFVRYLSGRWVCLDDGCDHDCACHVVVDKKTMIERVPCGCR